MYCLRCVCKVDPVSCSLWHKFQPGPPLPLIWHMWLSLPSKILRLYLLSLPKSLWRSRICYISVQWKEYDLFESDKGRRVFADCSVLRMRCSHVWLTSSQRAVPPTTSLWHCVTPVACSRRIAFVEPRSSRVAWAGIMVEPASRNGGGPVPGWRSTTWASGRRRKGTRRGRCRGRRVVGRRGRGRSITRERLHYSITVVVVN